MSRTSAVWTTAVFAFLCAGVLLRPSSGAIDANEPTKLVDRQKAVQQTLDKSELLGAVRAASTGNAANAPNAANPYVGKVQMVAASSDNTNTGTFWVIGNNANPVYKAYTIDFSQAYGRTMYETVLFAANKDVPVAVYSGGTPERPQFVVVYP